MYLGGVAVLMAELLKFGVSLIMVARDEGGLLDMVRAVRRTLSRANEMMRMAVPALSFGAQNFLYYVALSHLSATSYQLWSQTKTLFVSHCLCLPEPEVWRVPRVPPLACCRLFVLSPCTASVPHYTALW